MSFQSYFTEIVSKKEWEDNFKEHFDATVRLNAYKESLKALHGKIFKEPGQREIFIKMKDLKKLDVKAFARDSEISEIIDFLNQNSNIDIPARHKRSLLAIGRGIHKKSKKLFSIHEALSSMANRERGIGKMRDKQRELRHKRNDLDSQIDGEKTSKEQGTEEQVSKWKDEREKLQKQIEGVTKSIDSVEGAIRLFNLYKKLRKSYGLENKGDKIMVITYDPRKVASMSTEVSWRSCMELNTGMYRFYVPSTVESGAFIAYLTEPGERYSLEDPDARILLKPYWGNKGDVVWVPSKNYPHEAPPSFRKALTDWIEKLNKPTDDYYVFDERIYNDGDAPLWFPSEEKKEEYKKEGFAVYQKLNAIASKKSEGSFIDTFKKNRDELAAQVMDFDEWLQDQSIYNTNADSVALDFMDENGYNTDPYDIINNNSADDAARELDDLVDEYEDYESKKEELESDEPDMDDFDNDDDWETAHDDWEEKRDELEMDFSKAIEAHNNGWDRDLVSTLQNLDSDIKSDLEYEFEQALEEMEDSDVYDAAEGDFVRAHKHDVYYQRVLQKRRIEKNKKVKTLGDLKPNE